MHFCARCTGQVFGAVLIFVLIAVRGGGDPFLLNFWNQLPFAFLPFPAAVDWLTQSMGKRESSNMIRLTSGALLGSAFADTVVLLILQHWIYFLMALLVMVSYAAVLAGIIGFTGTWRRVVTEHFPEMEHSH